MHDRGIVAWREIYWISSFGRSLSALFQQMKCRQRIGWMSWRISTGGSHGPPSHHTTKASPMYEGRGSRHESYWKRTQNKQEFPNTVIKLMQHNWALISEGKFYSIRIKSNSRCPAYALKKKTAPTCGLTCLLSTT